MNSLNSDRMIHDRCGSSPHLRFDVRSGLDRLIDNSRRTMGDGKDQHPRAGAMLIDDGHHNHRRLFLATLERTGVGIVGPQIAVSQDETGQRHRQCYWVARRDSSSSTETAKSSR